MKRFVFDHKPQVDWKSIPTFDDAEDEYFDHSDLIRHPSLWCDASAEYRDQVLRKYREPLKRVSRNDGIYGSGEKLVDMIG